MRYHTSCGANPELKAAFFLSGPQDESQVGEEVRKLLDMPGIQGVAVFFDHGTGERVQLFRKMKE